MRRFEFEEGGSSKFWEIDQKGPAFTVRFGRKGTDGQSKTNTCGSADEAMAEVAKLIREKTKKGYQEIGAPGAAVEKALKRPNNYEKYEHCKHFANFAVVEFDPEAEEGAALKDLDRKAYAVRTDYEGGDDAFTEKLDALLADPKLGSLKALVIGQWGEGCSDAPSDVVEKLIAAKDRLTCLKALFLGDVTGEESEISWINQCDLTALLHALPNLEELVVRGGEGLGFSKLKHAGLRTLIVQSGGLPSQCVRDLAAADLPNLERIALWLGSDNYGGNTLVKDLEPILQGKAWPKLDYLGLMNSEITNDIARAMVTAPILARIRALDLSMGTLNDEGGLALLGCAAITKLKFLNLRRHYLSPEIMAKLKKLGIEVDVSDREEDDEYISCEVSE